MSDDNLHPAFKATLDKFCSDTARLAVGAQRKPDPSTLAANFSTAALDFDVKAKNAGAEIIGHAHALFFHHKKMSPGQAAMELDSLRDALRELNGSFAQLELAHAAMTVGETASRIRMAATGGKAVFEELASDADDGGAVMNAPAAIRPGTAWLTPAMLQSARDLAQWHEKEQNRPGTAATIYNLVAEIEALREAAKGSLVIVSQAVTDKNLATLKASTLLIVAEKIAPVIDEEIQRRKSRNEVLYVTPLQALSDELHAALRLVRA